MKDPITWGQDEDKVERHTRERGERGFSEFDWWNFDEYLTFVIIGGLEKFRDEGHGFPGGFESFEDWQTILNEMIAGFEAHQRLVNLDGWDSKATREQNDAWQESNEMLWNHGSRLFIKYFGHLWD